MALGKVEVAQFDGKADFQVWRLRMRALLSNHDVKTDLETDEKEWSADEKKRKRKIMKEAYNLLFLSLSDNILHKVCTCADAPTLWKRLEELYLNQVTTNLAYLKTALFAFKILRSIL